MVTISNNSSYIKYTLPFIINLQNTIIPETNTSYIDDNVSNFIFTLEYKFKERKHYKSKYNSPKPVTFADIRLNLNKLSNKTFDIHFQQIIATLHVLNTNECQTIFQDVFQHVSTTSFMYEPYSKLSSSLMNIFPEFNEIFFTQNSITIESFKNISFNSENTFESECTLNKLKDNYRSQIIYFCITLIKSDNLNIIIENIISLQNTMLTKLNTQLEYKTESEFISELISSYIKHAFSHIFHLDKWSIIYENITNILSKKTNTIISRKIIFNHMDTIDLIQKKKKLN
jgi:hypothetical protein